MSIFSNVKILHFVKYSRFHFWYFAYVSFYVMLKFEELTHHLRQSAVVYGICIVKDTLSSWSTKNEKWDTLFVKENQYIFFIQGLEFRNKVGKFIRGLYVIFLYIQSTEIWLFMNVLEICVLFLSLFQPLNPSWNYTKFYLISNT